MKTFRFAVAMCVFVVMLIAVYGVHVNFFKVNVVFYAAIADAVIAAVLTALLVFTTPVSTGFTAHEKGLLLLIWLIAGYAVAISVPTVIDRSLSFYILEKIQQRGGGIKEQGFGQVFAKEYLVEHRLVDVRLTEQLESGTIKIDHGCVKLTEKGQRLVTFSRYFRAHWLPKQRLLMGEYSADLTDPFKHSVQSVDYLCQ